VRAARKQARDLGDRPPALLLELVGVHEAAELLGLSRSAVVERRRAGTFPEPVAELRCGPIWRKADVEKHAHNYSRWDRRGGG